MMATKHHIPHPSSRGLRDIALCGRLSTFGTGDHAQIIRGAVRDINDRNTAHWCKDCVSLLRDRHNPTPAPEDEQPF